MQTNPNAKVNPALLAVLQKIRESGATKVVNETTIDEYREIENTETICEVTVPWKIGKPIKREERSALIPCIATSIKYIATIYKSRLRETIGDLTQGASADIFGYDRERDGHGNPINDIVKDPISGEESVVPRLIMKDEDGNPLEPKRLMSFRIAWGIDRTKAFYNRPRNQDQLALSANLGVPRKKNKTETVDEAGDAVTTTVKKPNPFGDPIDWAQMPNLQPDIEKPILNALMENNEAMLEFIGFIPIAPNAPSRQAKGTGGFKPAVAEDEVEKIAVELSDDAFAPPPEAKLETKTEAPVAEAQVDPPKEKVKGKATAK